MKKHERQRLDWLSVRKKGIDEESPSKGLAGQSVYVCTPWDQHWIGRRDGNWRL